MGAEFNCLILSPSLSMIKYWRTLISLPITPTEARVSEKTHRQQSNLSFQGRFPTIPIPVAIRFEKHFPFSAFHESTAKSANLCQFLLYSAERFPFLPWVAQGCSGFDWRNVEMHCRNSLTLSQPDISETPGTNPATRTMTCAKLRAKQICGI